MQGPGKSPERIEPWPTDIGTTLGNRTETQRGADRDPEKEGEKDTVRKGDRDLERVEQRLREEKGGAETQEEE
jgi:hypothetical protein